MALKGDFTSPSAESAIFVHNWQNASFVCGAALRNTRLWTPRHPKTHHYHVAISFCSRWQRIRILGLVLAYLARRPIPSIRDSAAKMERTWLDWIIMIVAVVLFLHFFTKNQFRRSVLKPIAYLVCRLLLPLLEPKSEPTAFPPPPPPPPQPQTYRLPEVLPGALPQTPAKSNNAVAAESAAVMKKPRNGFVPRSEPRPRCQPLRYAPATPERPSRERLVVAQRYKLSQEELEAFENKRRSMVARATFNRRRQFQQASTSADVNTDTPIQPVSAADSQKSVQKFTVSSAQVETPPPVTSVTEATTSSKPVAGPVVLLEKAVEAPRQVQSGQDQVKLEYHHLFAPADCQNPLVDLDTQQQCIELLEMWQNSNEDLTNRL